MSLELSVLQETRRFADGIDQSPCNGCDACGMRCVAGVPMLRPEYAAIEGFLASPEGKEARAVVLEDKQVPIAGAEGFHYIACRFRNVALGRCSIYPVRPLVCRLFGHVEWLPCPIQKVAAVPGGVETMQRYGDAIQHTYEEWQTEPSANDPA
jgi:Fe-S-cluster containining protein